MLLVIHLGNGSYCSKILHKGNIKPYVLCQGSCKSVLGKLAPDSKKHSVIYNCRHWWGKLQISTHLWNKRVKVICRCTHTVQWYKTRLWIWKLLSSVQQKNELLFHKTVLSSKSLLFQFENRILKKIFFYIIYLHGNV